MKQERSRPAAPKTAKVVLWCTLVFLYLPIAVMMGGSLLWNEGTGLQLSFHWFREVLGDEAWMGALFNSVVVAICSASIATVLGTLGALGLYKNRGAWVKTLDALSVASLIFPEIVFALSLLSWFFLLKFELGLATVVMAHVSFSISYVMMTVSARLATLEASLEDAARDLGASEWQVYKTVLLPLLSPAILGGFIMSFLLSFDDFLITYFVNGVGQDTLPVKLYAAMKMGVSPKLNALSTMMFLLTLLVSIFFFRSSAFRVLFEGARGNDGTNAKEEDF
ncbi:ABC transporter permease [Bdellovibrio sp.]|uniref:ABC transporter permease n=1 Tax=Bdellovibrio sp. TaxID=28201 RepID=UPI0039E6FE62